MSKTSTDEDIPLLTTLNFSKKEKLDLISTSLQNNRLAQFFIRDIIKAKKHIAKHITADEYYFEVFGVVFKKVYLRATVVAIEHVNMKLVITVDDGTASIRCFIEEAEALEDCREYIEEALIKISETGDENNDINQGNIALLQSLQNRIKDYSTPKQLQLGNVIEFTGLLNLYKEHYYVFIDEVRCDKTNDIQHDVDYYNDMLEFYRRKQFI